MILKCKRNVYRQFRKSLSDSRLEYFKREIKSVLKKQLNSLKDDVEKSFYIVDSLKKSMLNPLYESEIMEKAHREHLVPKQIRALNKKTGKTYTTTVYVNPNKQYGLNKYHETDSKGAKIAIAKLIKAVDKCQSEKELYKLVLRNKGRFSDNEGKPLPIVTELRKYVDSKNSSFDKKGKNSGVAKKLRDNFNNITEKYLNTNFTNKATGIEATFSKESQHEIRSNVTNSKQNGFTIQEHFEVANQIKELFEGATLEKEHEDTKHNQPDVRIERFLSKEITLKSGKKVRACITVKHSLDKNGRNIYSLETMDIKNALEKTRAKGQPSNGLSNNSNISQSDNSVKENNNDVNNESEKRATELKSHIESVFDKYMNDSSTRNTAESIVKKYGKKKLEDIANSKIKDDEEYKKFLTERVASVEKEEGKQLDDYTIDTAIWKHCTNVYIQKLAREKLKSMEANEKMVDLPVSDSDMDEAIGIIGSDVTRILNGRDTYGNAKQGLVDKIKRRVRNSPGVARAMLVYIKREQEKTGKKIFTEKHSIWELLPKLNERAKQAAEKGESETKTGVSGALYTGDDGTTVVENKDWGRYQISFPGKPNYETISTLKHNGFRWSPKTQTWVCYNTANGEYSLKRVAEKLGLKKNDVQKSIFLKVDEMRKSLFMEKGLWDRA